MAERTHAEQMEERIGGVVLVAMVILLVGFGAMTGAALPLPWWVWLVPLAAAGLAITLLWWVHTGGRRG